LKSKVIFRADGNTEIGLGHIYRLFALYEMYKVSYDCHFVTRFDSTLSVFPKTYNLHPLPAGTTLFEEIDWIKGKFPDSRILITDGYKFNSRYQEFVKSKSFKLIYIDDFAKELMHADIVINHSPHISPEDYNADTCTKFALGSRYAILRPGFLDAAKTQRNITHINTAFICFGGSDTYNLTLKTLKVLLRIKQIEFINIVIGEANRNKEIFDHQKENENVKIYKNLSERDLISLMSESHVAIAPASTILYEICAVNMMVLGGFYVNNQINIYDGLLKKKAIYGLGDFRNISVVDFENHVNNAINMDPAIQIQNQHQLFDGDIKKRFLALIENL